MMGEKDENHISHQGNGSNERAAHYQQCSQLANLIGWQVIRHSFAVLVWQEKRQFYK